MIISGFNGAVGKPGVGGSQGDRGENGLRGAPGAIVSETSWHCIHLGCLIVTYYNLGRKGS